MRRVPTAQLALALALSAYACSDRAEDGSATATTGSAGTGTTTGTGGSTLCRPGESVSCEGGPCQTGTQVCNADGSAYGPCEDVTPAAPPLTIAPGDSIQAAVDGNPEGTAFCILAGVHRMTAAIVPKADDVFLGEEGAVLNGSIELLSFQPEGNAWVAGGQTQEGDVTVASDVCRLTHPRCNRPEDLFIDGVPLHHVDTPDAGSAGNWHFDYAGDRIYLWDDPTGKTVETSATPYAFDAAGVAGVTVKNLVIEKYATPFGPTGALAMGTGWLVEDCELRLNHYAAIGNAPDSIARNNFVHDNGCFGFVGAGQNIVVEANEISYNNYAGFDPFWGAGGSKWVYTTNLVVRDNFSHHNLGPGLWTDINNVDVVYEGNLVEDNERGGIFHEISYAAVIRNNTLNRNGASMAFPYWTTGAAIEIVSSPNVEVYGNTLVDNAQAITALDDHRGEGTAGVWTITNLYVHDNMITSEGLPPGYGRTGIVDTAGTAAFEPAANNRFEANDYLLGPNDDYFMWIDGDCNESEWQAFGLDMNGTFQH